MVDKEQLDKARAKWLAAQASADAVNALASTARDDYLKLKYSSINKLNRGDIMSNAYKSALARLSRAHTAQDLEQLGNSFTRLYTTGFLTDKEFMRLDGRLVDKRIEIENT